MLDLTNDHKPTELAARRADLALTMGRASPELLDAVEGWLAARSLEHGLVQPLGIGSSQGGQGSQDGIHKGAVCLRVVTIQGRRVIVTDDEVQPTPASCEPPLR